MKWSEYEEDTLKSYTYMTDKEIAEYLTLKGYKRSAKQVSGKRERMNIRKRMSKEDL
jgi:hypothetical protein